MVALPFGSCPRAAAMRFLKINTTLLSLSLTECPSMRRRQVNARLCTHEPASTQHWGEPEQALDGNRGTKTNEQKK